MLNHHPTNERTGHIQVESYHWFINGRSTRMRLCVSPFRHYWAFFPTSGLPTSDLVLSIFIKWLFKAKKAIIHRNQSTRKLIKVLGLFIRTCDQGPYVERKMVVQIERKNSKYSSILQPTYLLTVKEETVETRKDRQGCWTTGNCLPRDCGLKAFTESLCVSYPVIRLFHLPFAAGSCGLMPKNSKQQERSLCKANALLGASWSILTTSFRIQ